MIWLNPLAAEVTRKPPMLMAKTCIHWTDSATVKYVITAENTTRAPNLNLVSFIKPENLEYVSELVKILLAVVSKKTQI